MNVKHLPFSTDQPELGLPVCDRGYCVKLNKDVITAETGLCAVIHCSFSTPSDFNPTSLDWYKCEPGGRCSDFDIIFHSKNKNKIQSSFLGRSYKIKITHDALWPVALQQKPTVQTPALTEGQHSALTCTAPGLCSGSEPTFTWTWRGAGDAPPNVTKATTDRLTPVNHRHSSTLWLTASAKLHGAELSCTVSYKPSSTQDSVRINVTCESLRTMMDPPTDEGDSLNVTCSVDSFPPSRLMWFGPNKTRLNVSETTESSSQTDLGSASLLIHNVTQAQSGQYMCEGLHLNSSQTTDVHISVCEIFSKLKFVYVVVILVKTHIKGASTQKCA
uniref:Ig-like domain-containing protein n=1 Tax=Neogobius melanostomus TaxID=47308 RepID=A0A8C6SRQ0_9GOBI